MHTPTFEFFEVGGAVRDSLMGLSSKDVDFTVVSQDTNRFQNAAEAFNHLISHLEGQDFKLFEVRREFLTIRAQVPTIHPLRQRTNVADFVLARKDGPYSDGRRPDWVKPGTLLDDLSRRDFRCNSVCRSVDGTLIDPFDGISDIQNKILQFVGNPEDRVREDGLRVMRAMRFEITKKFKMSPETWKVINSDLSAEMLSKVAVERIREELIKMFRVDTLASLTLLSEIRFSLKEAMFRDGLRLDATLAC